MSIVDKIIGAVTPPESDEARAEARRKATELASSGGWLSLVLDHHLQIENALRAVKAASTAEARRSAQNELATILVGHSIAEETVLYPALALHDSKAHATKGYTEQSAVKVQMAALDEMDPMSQDYLDKLEHIRGALDHHVYEEEGTWFPDLQESLDAAANEKLAARFQEEFHRYA